MSVLKFILRLAGWLVTIFVQIAMSFLIIFIFSVIFGGIVTESRLGWLLLLFSIWLGYVVGINLVGQVAMSWVWKDTRPLGRLRLIGTAAGALIPLLILLVIGSRFPFGGDGTQFNALITNNWQPVLAQASLFAAIAGYYIPGFLESRNVPLLST